MATGLHNSIHLVQTKPLRNLVAPFKSNILEKRLKAEDEAIQQENKHTQEIFSFMEAGQRKTFLAVSGLVGRTYFVDPKQNIGHFVSASGKIPKNLRRIVSLAF